MKGFSGLVCGGAVSIDRFSSRGAKVFLLTHCHTDHMEGLEDGWKLGKLYTTEQNRLFVLQRFRIDPRLIAVLPFYETVLVVGEGSPPPSWSITALPANHCPGSAMYHVVDAQGVRTLATGDFRFCDPMLDEPLLRNGVDVLYLDTTFCAPMFDTFPRKEESVAQVLALIDAKRVAEQTVFLEMEGLGCEQVLLAIAKKYRTKLFVGNETRREQLKLVPPFDRIVTDDPNECRFHVVSFMTLTAVAHGIQMPRIDPATVPAKGAGLFIKASVQYFFRGGYNDSAPGLCPVEASGVYHVLYSMHSSFSELVRFASLVQPKRVIPITDCDPDAFRQLCAPDKRARRSAHSPADDDDVLDWLV